MFGTCLAAVICGNAIFHYLTTIDAFRELEDAFSKEMSVLHKKLNSLEEKLMNK